MVSPVVAGTLVELSPKARRLLRADCELGSTTLWTCESSPGAKADILLRESVKMNSAECASVSWSPIPSSDVMLKEIELPLLSLHVIDKTPSVFRSMSHLTLVLSQVLLHSVVCVQMQIPSVVLNVPPVSPSSLHLLSHATLSASGSTHCQSEAR